MTARPSPRCPTRGFLAPLFALALAAAPAFVQAQTRLPSAAPQAPVHQPSAAAQAPAHQPSAAAIALARQIVVIKGAKKTIFDPLVRGVIEKVKSQFMQSNYVWADDLNAIAGALEQEYASKADELTEQSARIYASYFTEPELKQILAFYQTPVGRKMITDEPKALDATMVNAGEWGDKFSEQIVARIREEMKKRGHDL